MEQSPPSSRSASLPRIVRFGDFELDVRTAEMHKNGQIIRLQEQPLLILVELLERPGQLVLREEIRNRLWPDNTIVEFDHSINAAIKRLRDSLQDSAESPRFIETIAKRGYRFIAPVLREQDQTLQPEPASPITTRSVDDLDRAHLPPDASIAYWPIPALSSDEALSLARAGLQATAQYKTVILVARPQLWGQQMGGWENFTRTAQSLQSFYQAHGFQVDGFKISPGFWFTDGTAHVPADWSQIDLGNGAYRLNESTTFNVSGVENRESSALAHLQLSYTGCTAACAFFGDLRKESELGRFVVQGFSSDDWPRQQTIDVSYVWVPRRGWAFGGTK